MVICRSLASINLFSLADFQFKVKVMLATRTTITLTLTSCKLVDFHEEAANNKIISTLTKRLWLNMISQKHFVYDYCIINA